MEYFKSEVRRERHQVGEYFKSEVLRERQQVEAPGVF